MNDINSRSIKIYSVHIITKTIAWIVNDNDRNFVQDFSWICKQKLYIPNKWYWMIFEMILCIHFFLFIWNNIDYYDVLDFFKKKNYFFWFVFNNSRGWMKPRYFEIAHILKEQINEFYWNKMEFFAISDPTSTLFCCLRSSSYPSSYRCACLLGLIK